MTTTPKSDNAADGGSSPVACSASLAREIEILRTELHPLLAHMENLKRRHREALSREFIAANRITSDDVELSSGNGKPWFYQVSGFAAWLRGNSMKAWAEWNGRIYRTSDLIVGRMPDTPGEVDHLPNIVIE